MEEMIMYNKLWKQMTIALVFFVFLLFILNIFPVRIVFTAILSSFHQILDSLVPIYSKFARTTIYRFILS